MTWFIWSKWHSRNGCKRTKFSKLFRLCLHQSPPKFLQWEYSLYCFTKSMIAKKWTKKILLSFEGQQKLYLHVTTWPSFCYQIHKRFLASSCFDFDKMDDFESQCISIQIIFFYNFLFYNQLIFCRTQNLQIIYFL